MDAGGQADAIIPDHTHVATQASHNHKVPTGNTSGNHDTIVDEGANANATNVFTDSKTPAITVDTATGGQAVTDMNLPPYVKLAFIQRMT